MTRKFHNHTSQSNSRHRKKTGAESRHAQDIKKTIKVKQPALSSKGAITWYTCGNLTRFVYILRSINGVFDISFLGLWWSTEMTPSAEYPDYIVLPYAAWLLD